MFGEGFGGIGEGFTTVMPHLMRRYFFVTQAKKLIPLGSGWFDIFTKKQRCLILAHQLLICVFPREGRNEQLEL